MACGPKAVVLDLSLADRAALEALVRRRVGQAVAQRARIVLACAEPGSTNLGVAGSLGVNRPSVMRWRRRFADHGLEGLGDAPRSGAPRKVGDKEIERLIVLTRESQPQGATHWSTRTMARPSGDEPDHGVARVARLWPSAAPAQHVQAFCRPCLCGRGPRCGGAVHGPARSRAGALH